MTERERHIAEIAIDRRQAQNYGAIQEEVATMSGLAPAEIKRVLDDLCARHIIHEHATPAWNLAEGPAPDDYTTFAWYGKGSEWQDLTETKSR